MIRCGRFRPKDADRVVLSSEPLRRLLRDSDVLILLPDGTGSPPGVPNRDHVRARELCPTGDYQVSRTIRDRLGRGIRVGAHQDRHDRGICDSKSGRALARAPQVTFPAPPLKFRTSGFPGYGFKHQAPQLEFGTVPSATSATLKADPAMPVAPSRVCAALRLDSTTL